MGNWENTPEGLRRTYTFRDFPQAIEFLRAIVPAAEAENHHPDISVEWRTVTLTLVSHETGDVGDVDHRLAVSFDASAKALKSSE